MRLGMLPWILGSAISGQMLAQSPPVVTSFSRNGELTCANLEPGTTAVVEWASTPEGPWKSDWAGLDGVVVGPEGTIQVNVPMFYRVRGTAKNSLAIEPALAGMTVLENSTVALQVRLSAQPPADVVVSATSSNPTKAAVSPAALVFTSSNWSTYQNFSIQGVNDGDANDEASQITLSAPGLSNKVVAVTVSDEEQYLVTSASTIYVNEGSSGVVGIRLNGQPASNVSVNAYSANTLLATVSPAMMTFTPANWNTQQFLTVSGTEDANAFNGNTIIQIVSSSGSLLSINVSVIDND